MKQRIKKIFELVCSEYSDVDVDIAIERPEEKFGDYSTNIAMQLAGKLGKSPREIAEQIAVELNKRPELSEVNIADPGFINVRLKDNILLDSLDSQIQNNLDSQTFLLEYSCPNAFKELHAGHLYQTLIGDSLARMYEYLGAKVFRISYGGDVGQHAAKCMWGVLQKIGGEENYAKLECVENRAKWISEAYIEGSKAYEEPGESKQEIENLNKRIYDLHEKKENGSNFANIYFTCRQWSYDYFDEFYRAIDVVAFDKYYPESEITKKGVELVKSHIGTVFSESEGAIVFDESRSGLHTRVFITKKNLPTYEAKDLGVVETESEEFPYDSRIIFTGNEQKDYMRVIFKAIEFINPDLAAKQTHRSHGLVKFGDGTKMSSRLGNVTRATDVISAVDEAARAENPKQHREVGLGAVKYSLLKNRVGGDIAFDLEQSVSMEGNSGPYLQYALVRARAILDKVKEKTGETSIDRLEVAERSLARKLTEFDEAVLLSIADLSPHHLCGYLYELAQVFNRFYESSRVIDDPRTNVRALLVKKYEKTLANGLELIGVPVLESM